LAEGVLVGEDGQEEWGLQFGSGRGGQNPAPPRLIQPGERVYIVSHGYLRGYAPLVRIEENAVGFELIRRGGAVAVTLRGPDGNPAPMAGFQGVRYRRWERKE